MSRRTTDGITRRDFIRATGAVALGAAVAQGAELPQPEAATKSKVVLVRDAAVLDDKHQLDAEVLARMLDQAVSELVGVESPSAAWQDLLAGAKSLGIKTNVWRMLRTPPELERTIQERAMACGIPEAAIATDDRGAMQTLAGREALINVRPLRTHHWSGIGGCLKNYIMFSDSPPAWHPDGCADLGGLMNLPAIKGKTRLHLLVVLTPQFHGKGPHHFDPRYVWDYKGLIASRDPVAADATGVRLLVAKRLEFFGEDVPFATHTRHVEVAETKHHVGVADPHRIELVKLGWQDDVLI